MTTTIFTASVAAGLSDVFFSNCEFYCGGIATRHWDAYFEIGKAARAVAVCCHFIIVCFPAIQTMNTKPVSIMGSTTLSRLVTVGVDALLVDVAELLSDTQISLVVVCNPEGVMVGIITKTNIVQRIGHCQGASCTSAAYELMIRDVTYCHPGDRLEDVLAMMAKRGFVHIPVIDKYSRPLGVVNARDALRTLPADEEYEESMLRDYAMGVGYQ